MAEQWLSIIEYARATGISDMTIRRRIRCGRIKAELRDGKYFIPVDVSGAAVTAASIENNRHSHSQVVKSRPSSMVDQDQDFASDLRRLANSTVANPQRTTFSLQNDGRRVYANEVPDHLVQPLVEAGLASIEARSLLEFCDKSLMQAKVTVEAIERKYQAQVEALNAQLNHKNQEIRSLQQQTEDLQLLVQILERKKAI